MIRSIEKKDIDSVNKLGLIFNSNFLNTYNISNYIDNKNYIILVNEDNNINAFLIVYKNIDYFEIEVIVVDINNRKMGIANNLMNYFFENYTNTNDKVLLEVAVNNKVAINLYKKFDFKVIHTRKHYYNNVDAYVMKKVI